MKRIVYPLLVLTLSGGFSACQAQPNKPMSENKNNPLLCDPEQGICEIPTTTTNASLTSVPAGPKPVKIIYFTDPICSSCWGMRRTSTTPMPAMRRTTSISSHWCGCRCI